MNTNPRPQPFPRDEVEAAFRHSFLTGPVREDWIAWSQLFTDDAVYFDHFYGRFHVPREWWLGCECEVPAIKRVEDMDFGERVR